MTKRIANLISGISSPFSVGFILIVLVSLEASESIPDAIKWSLILIGLTILPVFIFTVYLFRAGRLDGFFTGVRKQRILIYVLSVILAVVSCIVLFILKAPLMLLSLSVAGFAGITVFLCISFWWKISLHTAFIAVFVTVLFVLYGTISTVSIPLVLLVGWARFKLGHHSTMQIIAGAILGSFILLAAFNIFSLT